MTTPRTPFAPSSRLLLAQIESAMRKCDADIEQTKMREEARADDAYARRVAAETEGRRRRLLWG